MPKNVIKINLYSLILYKAMKTLDKFQGWRFPTVIPALKRLEQEDHKSEASMAYISTIKKQDWWRNVI